MFRHSIRADGASLDVMDAVFEVLPWPALMLDHDGGTIVTSEERAGAPGDDGLAAVALPSLRERAGHYLAALRPGPPWSGPQEAETTRTLATGDAVHERLLLRPANWGFCLIVMQPGAPPQPAFMDAQTARLAALGFMVAGVSHEISNPLTSLHSVVQLLRSEPQLEPELLRKGLDNIAGSVRKILDISRRLVTFSRVGDEPRAPLQLDAAVDEALQTLRQEGLLEGVELRRTCNPGATVTGNIGQLAEVFLNLMLNAVQAMPGGGGLSVETRTSAGSAEVVVSDSGPGLTDAVRSRLFEPFFTTKALSRGTGLGLAISREIVLEHGGSLIAEHVASGASFRVELPRAAP